MPSSNCFGRLCADKLRSRSFVCIEVEEASNERVHSSNSIGCRDVDRRRIHPTSTLKKITDDDADTKPGEIADDINEENGRAQGLAYEKELGEAKDDTMVEILVTRLKNDTTCRTLACPKIECWAARHGFVNIVMALIQFRGQSESLEKEVILLTAVENNHVGLVQRLIAMPEVNVNHGVANISYWNDCTSGRFTDRHDHFCWVTPIDAAARMGNVEMVNILLACDRIDVNKGQPLLWATRWNHPQVVEALLNDVKSQVDVNAVQYWHVDESITRSYYGRSFTALHVASFYGHTGVVNALCADPKKRLEAHTENKDGVTSLQIAVEMKHEEIARILMARPEVEKDMKRLYRDRQVHVDAANAILVLAALIATVTFAGWLTPPLGCPHVGAPSPSGNNPSFASIEGHPIFEIFWVFNSMSFFFAIATLMVAATAARAPRTGKHVGILVQSLHMSLLVASVLLTVSVACVMGAFASAGFAVMPPVQKYTTIMQVTVAIVYVRTEFLDTGGDEANTGMILES
ncbi:unnamed protein product [Sphagnum troendelagicum]|uniref:PGG domain-containing protein n=1 Tax=Sphagnum troendelagicum TaxID=128251 RepID=A0ABP0UBH1_9BRYO